MRDYQPKKNNQYYMDDRLWRKTLFVIRDYYRLKTEYDDRINEGMSIGSETLGGKTNRTGDPTGLKAVKLAVISEQIRAIEKARLMVPYEYMDGVWDSILYYSRYPSYADRHTYGYWKRRFVFEVAKNLNWI